MCVFHFHLFAAITRPAQTPGHVTDDTESKLELATLAQGDIQVETKTLRNIDIKSSCRDISNTSWEQASFLEVRKYLQSNQLLMG